MRLLLKEDVDNLGSVGDEVVVKDGYGRNYLIPQGKALLATPKNLKAFSHQKGVVMRRLKKLKGVAEEVAQKIAQVDCTITKKVGEQGKLYGSVTAQELADILHKNGVNVDRRKIQMPEPIKTLGEHTVGVKLHVEVTAELKVNVLKEETEEEKAEAEAAEAAATEETPAETETAETTDAPAE